MTIFSNGDIIRIYLKIGEGLITIKDKILNLLTNKLSKEVIIYVIAGVATTLVNFVVYYIFKNWLTPTASNIVAWAVSVLFAYAVNSRFVFEMKPDSLRTDIKMLVEFVAARIISGAVESLSVYIFVEKLAFNDFIIKVLVSIFVIVFNYLVSKLCIFRKKNKE